MAGLSYKRLAAKADVKKQFEHYRRQDHSTSKAKAIGHL